MGKLAKPFSKQAFTDPLGVFTKSKTDTSIADATVDDPTSPVAPTAPEVLQASMDLRQQQLMKKGIKNTVKAGDTGGFMANPMKNATPNANVKSF